MKLTVAEFEETEYRGALFNQLATNQFVWEPGQVFEQYIGLDYALMCTHPALGKLLNWVTPPPGVMLNRLDLHYIWMARGVRKKLPPFRLNMFVQAKRPQFGRQAPAKLRAHGLRSPFWRFETTPHQQEALTLFANKLGSRAIVTYASPVFHKSADLYRHTINETIVEASTFPSAAALARHDAWNYSSPGAVGVANADPVRVQEAPLIERFQTLLHSEQSELDAASNLGLVSRAITDAVEVSGDFLRARFADGIRTIDQASRAFGGTEGTRSAKQFLKVMLFSDLFRVRWFVVGSTDPENGPG